MGKDKSQIDFSFLFFEIIFNTLKKRAIYIYKYIYIFIYIYKTYFQNSHIFFKIFIFIEFF